MAATHADTSLARRLSFAAAVDNDEFPLQQYKHYLNDGFESQFNFWQQLQSNPPTEQTLVKAQEQLEKLKVEYLEIAIRERFLQALVDSGADGINITQADVDQKKQEYIQSEMQREQVAKQVESEIHSADQIIAKVCNIFDEVRRDRDQIRSELNYISRLEQQRAFAESSTPEAIQSSSSKQTMNMSNYFSEQLATLTQITGVKVAEIADAPHGGVMIRICIRALQLEIVLVATFDRTLLHMVHIQIEPPTLSTIFQDILTSAIDEKSPVAVVVRQVIERIHECAPQLHKLTQ